MRTLPAVYSESRITRVAFLLLIIMFLLSPVQRVMAQPKLNSFFPATAIPGAQVTISGSQFGSTAAANTVYFGAVKATVVSASASSLVVTVPKGASYSQLSVTVNGLTAYSPLAFIPVFSGGTDISGTSLKYNQSLVNDYYPHNLSFADFDGDGKTDVLALKYLPSTETGSYIIPYLNNGSGAAISFAAQTIAATGLFSNDMVTADFDGDGKLDAAVTNIASKEVVLLKNTSSPGVISFAPAIPFTTGEALNYIAAGDIDGDGKIDLIGTNSISSNATILKNQSTPGNISFVTITPFGVGLNAGMLVLSDLNGDTKPDIAVANDFGYTFSIYPNTSTAGSFSFGTPLLIPTPDNLRAQNIAASDLDQDGKNDLLFTTADYYLSTGSCWAFRNTGNGGALAFDNTGALPDGGVTGPGFCPALSDINGDGKPDVLLGKGNGKNSYQVWQNQSAAGSFSFNLAASFTALTPYRIAGADLNGDGKPEIGTANFASNTLDIFSNRTAQLTVTGVTPATAGQGDSVVISGSNFSAVTAVSFGGVQAASFSVISATQIKALIGNGASGNLVVKGAAGNDSLPDFVYDNSPRLDSFRPVYALPGDTIVIKGKHLLNTSKVTIGDVAVTWFSVKDVHTILVVPGPNEGVVKVVTPFGESFINEYWFRVLHKPVISYFYPTEAHTGEVISIIGQWLTTPGYLPEVTLGGVPIQVLGVNGNESEVYGLVGDVASGSVKISTFGLSDSMPGFTFVPPPQIISFTPAAARPADTVTISGLHFLFTTRVSFGDSAAASFTVVNDSLIRAVVGHGKTGSITVERVSGISVKAGFTLLPLPAPVIQSFSPQQAIAGTTLTITGQNLWGVLSVTVGSTPAKLFNQVNPGKLEIIAPVNASGNITVTTYYGSYTLTAPAFTRIVPATITSIAPLSALPGNTLTISGQGFGTSFSAVDVHFGPVKAIINSLQDNMINVTIPVSAAYGPLSITVQGLTSFSTQRFTPVNPAIAYLDLNPKSFIEVSNIGTDYPVNGVKIFPMDLNGDSKPDFVNLRLNQSVDLYINTSTPGKPSWRFSHTAPNITLLDDVQIGDIDGDSKPDLLMHGMGPTRYILRNTSTIDSCSFAAEHDVTTEPGLLYDVNNDGKPDITRPDPVTFQPQILVNNSLPGFISFKDTISNADQTPLESWRLLMVADIDRDGLPDLVGARYLQILIFHNNGTRQLPSFNQPPIIINSYYNPVRSLMADMNGDGFQDLFMIHAGAAFSIYKNVSTPGNIQLKTPLIVPAYGYDFEMFETGDLNGDNKLDVVSKTMGQFVAFQNNSSADSIILKDMVIIPDWHGSGCVADIDGDNKQDLVTASSSLVVQRNRMGESQRTIICANSTVYLPATIKGSSYQWQMDTGSGFVNISNNANFSNTNGDTLTITNTPSGWLKRQFRCKINNSILGEPYFLEFEDSFVSNLSRDWNTAANWGCGVVPDGNVNVSVTNGKIVQLSGDASCRSLSVDPYGTFTALPGSTLLITNK